MKICIAIAAILIMFMACSENEPTESRPVRINHRQAQEMMLNDDVLIIDVRTPEEFAGGFIENAILIPVNEIETLAPALIPDKGRTLLVYCRSGSRSNAAAHTLVRMGFTSVYDFGGIMDWEGPIKFSPVEDAIY